MKKVILSVAIVAGMLVATNVQKVHATQEQPTIAVTLEDDGFADVQLQDLSEVIQSAIGSFAQEYDIKALKYNAEKQIAKVVMTNKDDQSEKTIYLNAEGSEVEAPESEAVQEGGTPSAVFSGVMQDDGFVDVKYSELSEKVQSAVQEISQTYDVTSLKFNEGNKIYKVDGINKEDQSKKEFFLNEEGQEVEQNTAQADQQLQQTESEETPMLR